MPFLQTEQHAGRITLVGAGPGDPELLTLAGARALAAADLVVYDRLVNPALLELAPQAEHVYAGKQPGEPHEETQARTNRMIVEQARRGRDVVRLKGGDPFIFGRGGEELLAARVAGIETRVIPGITAALGAAAAADLPLTHRHLAGNVAFVTGCPATDRPQPHADWAALARAVDTLVLYMGVRHLASIAGALILAGRPADEPVAIVQAATTPQQKIHHFTLEQLHAGAAEVGVEAPALVVIGPVVRVHHELQALARQTLEV